ncbi:aldolase [Lachnospiraceae bacterium WCA-9-b2]|uniref:Aldolase n=1 Tax=Sporofaciens musculi TaxID=2681861 RepID=A0A7X3MKF6_9FIRM|nr:aldolase/citrate lyase family protein [Sporofaciens musculi]MXP77882.1 aldolase [Sporofaciens musculi]
MPLKLMYITNKADVAQIAEAAGVDRIFVDMEYIGKANRQGGMDTVQNHHTLEDVRKIAQAIEKAELLVRINPIHEETEREISSKEEIDKSVEYGADLIMLPYFKTSGEVHKFIEYVKGRVKTMLLVETPEAVEIIDDILKINGIDEIMIGLNDLSLAYKKKFMFELLSDGTVEDLCYKFKKAGIPYGFGGIAAIGKGELPAERIITEHYRLGSTRVILSRSFCNTDLVKHLGIISETFIKGVKDIRDYEEKVSVYSNYFKGNENEIKEIIRRLAI